MIVFKVGFLLVASVAVFVGTQININLSRKRKSSLKIPENDDLIFQQEQGEDREKDKFEDSNLEPKQEEGEIKSSISKAKHDKKWKDVTEIEILKHRKVTLEVKLLELYGLKEQKIYTSQLQSQLKEKMGEIDMLNVTLNALYSEIEKLHEEIEQNELAKEELEIDKRAIWEIQAKARGDQEQMKGQLVIINDQVFGLRVDEMKSNNGDFKVEKRLKAMKDVEFEVLKLRRKNKEFELEKRELAIKLDAAEARITVLSNMTESKHVADIKGEISNLSLANKKLTKQVEKLHKNRFSMVEELVYLKWLNTTMRIEVQNYHNPPEKKSKTRITNNSSTDYSFRSVSSSESDKITGSTTFDSSSSSQKSAVKKFNLIRSIKRWGRSKDDLSAISSPPSTTKKVRRFSASMVPSKTSFRREKMQDPNTRARRVSFQDLLDAEEMVENHDEQIISAKGSKERIVHTDIRNEFGGGLDKKELPVLLSSVKFDVVKSNDSSKSGGLKIDEIASAEELPSVYSDVPLNDHNKVGDQMVHFIVAVLFFFVLMLLVYFIDLNCGIY